MKNITIYTTPTCGYCKLAKAYLQKNHISFKEIDVSRDVAAAQKMVDMTGQVGVPQIFVDDEVIIGFDRPMLDHVLGINKKHS